MAYAVRRLCSDFMDMLRRLISCRIIIIIIIIVVVVVVVVVVVAFSFSSGSQNLKWYEATF